MPPLARRPIPRGLGVRAARNAVVRALLLALAAEALVAQPSHDATGAFPPVGLRCEYLEDPIGIDETSPRLSWIGSDPRRRAVQRAYRILVADSADKLARGQGNLWDSGIVSSDRSAHVSYSGTALRSRQKCYWRVQTWNGDLEPSGWSRVATFEIGLLDPRDWVARWIGPAESLLGGKAVSFGDWIWDPDGSSPGQSRHFRATFRVGDVAAVAQAVLKVAADDAFVLFVNGTEVDRSEEFALRASDIRPHLVSGVNVLGVRVLNVDGDGGLILGGRVDLTDARRIELGTGEAWRVSDTNPPGWALPGFDDSEWKRAASLGPHGVPPWRKIEDDRGARRSAYVRREFLVDRPLRSARLYVSGLGLYEVSINGRKIGRDALEPGFTHYPKRVQYRTYDVTGDIRVGRNAIGALLGNGWWSGGLGWLDRHRYSSGGLRFIAQLELVHEDGEIAVVATDRSFVTHRSPVVSDSLYDGEAHDARLEIAGWDEPGLDDAEWARAVEIGGAAAGRLVARRSEPIRPTAEIAPRSSTKLETGETILDFGQNLAGRVRIRVAGERGTRVTLRFGELVHPDGSLDASTSRGARATDRYVLKGGGEEVWEPRFTYHGFRYVEVTGDYGEIDPASFTAVVLHTDAPRTGEFRSSDPLLNKIHQNVVWTERSNLYDLITDCPQRDERLGWTGDAVIGSPTLVLNMGAAPVLSKWMRDVLDSQARDGSTTDVAPVFVQWGPAAPGWGDAIVTIPFTLYLQYGDTRVIEDCYEGMRAFVEYMRANAPGHLYEREGYGDWAAIAESPKAPIGAAFYFHSTRLLSQMARLVGRDGDAREYAELSARVKRAFNAAYFDSDAATYAGGTQTANVLPLAFGLVDAADECRVLGTIVADIEARGGHLSTGFLGTAFLMGVLARGGRNDVAHALATQRSFPSWGHMVGKGATTLWELWDPDLQYDCCELTSRNHQSLSSIGRWFYEELGGLHPLAAAPGYKRTVIRPYVPPGMASAFAELDTVHGRLASRWQRAAGSVTLELLIPPNTSAEVWVPFDGPPGAATIEESGATLVSEGGSIKSADGVRFLRFEAGYAVFDVAAGTYAFRSHW